MRQSVSLVPLIVLPDSPQEVFRIVQHLVMVSFMIKVFRISQFTHYKFLVAEMIGHVGRQTGKSFRKKGLSPTLRRHEI